MKKNRIALSTVNSIAGFPVKASTLRKWRHINKYPNLFVSLGRKVFVDMDELERLFK